MTPFTSRARVALAIARAIAAGRGDVDVTAIHIALGLLREAENAAVAALQHAGADIHAIRNELEAELGPLPPPGRTRPEEVVLSLTPGEARVVAQARTASRLNGDEYIGPAHLLLGILRDERSAAARLFAGHGLDGDTAPGHIDAVVINHRNPLGEPPSRPPSD